MSEGDVHRTLLTLVCEELVAARVIADLERLGAPGWTATNAHGAGHSGTREGRWEHDANLRIEVVCDDATARRLADHLRREWYEDYRVVCWLSRVEILRPERF